MRIDGCIDRSGLQIGGSFFSYREKVADSGVRQRANTVPRCFGSEASFTTLSHWKNSRLISQVEKLETVLRSRSGASTKH